MQYAPWGMDYLQYDWCNTQALYAEGAYLTMRQAPHAAGRPIVFSLCVAGSNKPWEWGKNIGHLWRTTGDIINCFDCFVDHGTWKSWGITCLLDMQDGLRVHARPGHWNDPKMMEVGNGMSVSEDRAHFSPWCMLAAPLLAGNDLRNMTPETAAILINRDATAANQAPSASRALNTRAATAWRFAQAAGTRRLGSVLPESWSRGAGRLLCQEAACDQGYFSERAIDFTGMTYAICDVWGRKSHGITGRPFAGRAESHDVILLKRTPLDCKPQDQRRPWAASPCGFYSSPRRNTAVGQG